MKSKEESADAAPKKNTTSIFKAIENDDRDKVKELIEIKHVPLNITTKLGQNVAHMATLGGKLDILKYLVEKEPSLLESKTNLKQNVAHIAALNNEVDVLKYLVEKKPSFLQDHDVFGSTPLFTAIEKGSLDVIKYLVETVKIDINELNAQRHNNSAIHIAAQVGGLEVLKYFIKERSADVNLKNNIGRPPAFLAAEKKHLNAVKFFVEETNFDVYTTDDENCNILFMCARRGDVAIPKYLLDVKKLNFDINHKDKNGRTVIFTAVKYHHIELLKYFCENKNADIHVRDDNGTSVLHQASMVANLKIAKYLIEHGADIKAENNDGKKASHVTEDSSMRQYLGKLEQERVRRSVGEFFDQRSAYAAQIPATYARARISGDLFELAKREDGDGPVLMGRAISSQVNNFLTLLGVSMKLQTKQRRKRDCLTLSQEIIEHKIDPLALSSIKERFEEI